jgi:hypothetical protein
MQIKNKIIKINNKGMGLERFGSRTGGTHLPQRHPQVTIFILFPHRNPLLGHTLTTSPTFMA